MIFLEKITPSNCKAISSTVLKHHFSTFFNFNTSGIPGKEKIQAEDST